MTPSLTRFLTAAGAMFVFAGTVFAQSAVITKARAYLGTDAALDAVTSVHYTGTLVTASPDDPAKQTRATIDIIFQKPDQQRILSSSDKVTETTALDGYEAWQRTQNIANPSDWRQTLLLVEQIKRMRANTWENLAFFRGIEKAGGKLEVMEPATIDGVACQKIAFVHAPNIIFVRSFDQNTGKLVLTETETGSTIREQGEVMVDGIRFPKSIVTQTKNSEGKLQTVTITFEQIKLNETFPASMFAVPGLGR